MDDPTNSDNRHISLQNQCNQSKSPYVRAHASNATAWQLWSPETLALAKRLNRVLFVSIGYSACHWCHVMAHESFAHARIAQLLNERFVPVKLDREERPDVDRQYMDFLQATSGGGGWPLNVFVTPDLEPIFGGTYWPGPDSERARLGGVTFEQILGRVADAWKEQESRCRENGRHIVQQLREFAQEGTLGGRQGTAAAVDEGGDAAESDGLELDLLEDSYEHYKARFDDKYGGFGGAPKFPTPMHLRFLLRLGSSGTEVVEVVGDEECQSAREMALTTLENMARGGIKDQVGHGFARYSVARDWSLQHFEKMLYDNAQLLSLYLDAYLLTSNPLFLSTIHDIATYLTSPPMLSQQLGGINASEDADSLPDPISTHPIEGAFYVWTHAELSSLLEPTELQIATKYWGVEKEGNIQARYDAEGELAGKNTLCVQYPSLDTLASEMAMSEEKVKAAIESAREKLRAYRDAERPRPALDDKLLTSWNGLAISALARTGAALSTSRDGDDEGQGKKAKAYTDAAVTAANCIRKNLYDERTGTLYRVWREGRGDTPGFADDYAFLIAGLLDLYEATFDDSWLAWAETLQGEMLNKFWDGGKGGGEGGGGGGGGGGFFSTPANQPDILIRSKDGMDNAEPSTNGRAVTNLFRLASYLNDSSYERKARQTLAAFEVEVSHHPALFSGLLEGVVNARVGIKGLMLVGQGKIVDRCLELMRGGLRPGFTVLRVGGNGVKDAWLRERNELLLELNPDKEMVQLCEGTSCRILSLEDVEEMFR